MNISEALKILDEISSAYIYRHGWNGKCLKVRKWPSVLVGDNYINHHVFTIEKQDGSHRMWVPSMSDLGATDWDFATA